MYRTYYWGRYSAVYHDNVAFSLFFDLYLVPVSFNRCSYSLTLISTRICACDLMEVEYCLIINRQSNYYGFDFNDLILLVQFGEHCVLYILFSHTAQLVTSSFFL